VGIAIFFGYDKTVELAVASHIYDVTLIEQKLLPQLVPAVPTTASSSTATDYASDTSIASSSPLGTLSNAARVAAKALHYNRAPEITSPSGYINTNGQPITIGQFKGKKVVLVDIWTYSCINCQRTIPYLKEWYDKYHDQGLEIIGIHTPEFAFEKVQTNVQEAVKSFGIMWPVVLDNEYGTWNAFGNQFWPRKYLIDSDGFIVYDHAGEGNYDVTEKAIQKALAERAQILGQAMPVSTGTVATPASVSIEAASPETYFGASRNEYLGNGTPGASGKTVFSIPNSIADNMLYLGGTWNILDEYAVSTPDSSAAFKYTAKGMYFVAGAPSPITIEVLLDGAPIPASMKGADITYKDGKSYVTVQINRLYKLIDASSASTHILKLVIPQAGLQAFTFTFG
jgi:thiol-disulfide isomerase/thioredoxin